MKNYKVLVFGLEYYKGATSGPFIILTCKKNQK